jgi:hypothetical protein
MFLTLRKNRSPEPERSSPLRGSPIEKWFSGKALAILRSYVLPTLAQAESDGYWPKGASRKVKAALNKQTVAIKYVRENRALIVGISEDRTRSHPEVSGWGIVHAMEFGQFAKADAVFDLINRLVPYTQSNEEKAALGTALEWASGFSEIARLVELLDSTRPKPVVVMGTLSPTVVANLNQAMGIDMRTISSPPIKWTWQIINGQRVAVGHIVWPEGTRHGQSRFAAGTDHNSQCHACGHAIKDGFNWVPIVATTSGKPVSLWVGRDCARKLFSCEVTGDAVYPQRTSKAK